MQIGRLRLPVLDEISGQAIPGSEERLVNRGMRLWPRDHVAAEVENLMMGANTRVKAIADERGVVFARAMGVVLVSFDSAG